MYVQWREREHEAANELVAADPNVVAVLTQCGLVKFFLCPFMHAQPRLLNALVDYWHPDAEAFMLEGQSLVPTTEDIYFLTGLSRRGEPVNFQTFPAGPSKVSELIESTVRLGPIIEVPRYLLVGLPASPYRLFYCSLGGLPAQQPCIRLRAHR
jgi:hypothetical protein